MSNDALANLLSEDRVFPPSADFAAQANASSEMYDEAAADRLAFWAEQARYLTWEREFDEILDWSDAPFARWFTGGTLNVAYNCVDRHVENGFGTQVAIRFEGEPGDRRDITYAELKDDVCKAANALLELGVASGDRVAIYMPMIPEAIVAMLACARIGAAHSVVFAGFSSEALRSRIDDAQAVVVITADGQNRRGSAMPLKPAVDEAVSQTPTVTNVLVVRRTGGDVDWDDSRDVWWHDIVDRQSPDHTPEAFDAEHPLFILYTSGTTGKPKGILRTSGGYLTQAAFTHRNVFDLKPDDDIYWCTADIGWVTGHSYIVYGPLANRVTQVVYEGTPDTPGKDRWWDIVERHKVSIFYTAPTAIRTFMKWGDELPQSHDLSSLRLLGSVGEPINPEAWMWYRDVIGSGTCPIVDTWWQTETGGHLLTPLPGATPTKPGSATTPFFGVQPVVLDPTSGQEIDEIACEGVLCLKDSWPGQMRTVYGDHERFVKTYFSDYKGYYFSGDGCRRDADGYYWITGRVDDVINVSGHRMGTAEVESALVAHPKVAEAAVVGAKDEDTGQAVCAFVILRDEAGDGGDDIVAELRQHVRKEIGPIATPRQVMVVPELPKTRSGKIMRRLLRDVAENREVGDVTTLADSSVMDLISSGLTSGKGED